jgi:hypothetical protein
LITYKVKATSKGVKQIPIHHCPKHGEEECQRNEFWVNIFTKIHLLKKDRHGCEMWYYKYIPFASYFRPKWIEAKN